MSRGLRALDAALWLACVIWLALRVGHELRANVDYDDRHYLTQATSLVVDHDLDYRDQPLYVPVYTDGKQPGFALLGAALHPLVVRLAGAVEPRDHALPEADYRGRYLPPDLTRLWDTLGRRYHDASPGGGRVVWEWSVAWSLAIATILSTLLGLLACVWAIRAAAQARLVALAAPLCVAPLVLCTSHVFLHNLLVTPMYPTCAAFGAAAGYVAALCAYAARPGPARAALAGLLLGVLVLIRFEAALLAPAAIAFLGRDRRAWVAFLVGAAPAAIFQLAYDHVVLGAALRIPALTGGLNRLGVDVRWLAAGAGSLITSGPLVALGLAAAFGGERRLRALCAVSLAVIVLALFRLPTQQAITPDLAYFDVNRYAVIAYPAAILGLADLLGRVLPRRVAP